MLEGLEQAGILLEEREQRGQRLGRAWALAPATRYQGRLAPADDGLQTALVALEHALREHRQLPHPSEPGCTLQVPGTVLRHGKQKAAAKIAPEQTLAIFERLGVQLWPSAPRRRSAGSGYVQLPDWHHRVRSQVAELVPPGTVAGRSRMPCS
jgi:hypothetical protein